ncbi:extensin-like [Triticum aestivum]|uniref:extensin-like n=1 Tax=Triticum aestivum TaxID=4565 RepID=UPI001D014B6F|nr:extensin-like [Triticum aestivum]
MPPIIFQPPPTSSPRIPAPANPSSATWRRSTGQPPWVRRSPPLPWCHVAQPPPPTAVALPGPSAAHPGPRWARAATARDPLPAPACAPPPPIRIGRAPIPSLVFLPSPPPGLPPVTTAAMDAMVPPEFAADARNGESAPDPATGARPQPPPCLLDPPATRLAKPPLPPLPCSGSS